MEDFGITVDHLPSLYIIEDLNSEEKLVTYRLKITNTLNSEKLIEFYSDFKKYGRKHLEWNDDDPIHLLVAENYN